MNPALFKYGLLQILQLTFILLEISELCFSHQPENLAIAKRQLYNREQMFLKSQPMSENLRNFIDRFRKSSKISREKRGVLDENQVYIIQDGHLVPLQKAKKEENSNVNGFTVVPLVVPIKEEKKKSIKTRTINEDVEKIDPKQEKLPPVSVNTSQIKLENLEDTITTPNSEENEDNKTKEETVVLHKILDDIEGLMMWRNEEHKKDGVLCNINGSWISEAAGMRFDICYNNSNRKKFRVHLADRIPPNEDGFLCDGNWTVFGELPFLHSGMVLALAVHQKDRHIATFIGECRTCDGSETVTGTWLLGRSSRDCKDQKAAHKILADIWRREEGHLLRKKHLQKLGYTIKDDD